MKILMISGDPQILNEASNAARRMKDYGRIVDRLDIFVLGRRARDCVMPAVTLSRTVSAEAATGRFVRFFIAWRKAAYLLGRNRYDLITAQDTEHAAIAWLLSRRFKIPFEMQVHTDIMSPQFRRLSLANRARYWTARFLLGRANGVRAVSFRIAQSIRSLAHARIVPVFIDADAIRRTPAEADLRKKYPTYEKIVLMASRLTREKNFPLAIRAMRRVVAERPRALLVIAGAGPERRRIMRSAMRMGMASNVALEGAVSLPTLASYYKTADVYLLASDYEGYGRTLVEAALAGCPIVSTDVGIAEEIKGAYIVPVRDGRALADALLRQLALPRRAPEPPLLPSWSDYLKAVKESFEQCGRKF